MLIDDLAAITQASSDLERARVALVDAVRNARAAGASWAEIADALGVTKQAAWERFRATPL